MDNNWLERYRAAKNGTHPPPQPPAYPQQPYAPPGYQQPPPVPQQQPYAPQPMPGAPPHAPFGYDPHTGVPVAPYGRDQYGNVIVQPVYYPPQPPPQQQTMYDPRGMPVPNGYGQPPYGQTPMVSGVRPEDTIYMGSDGNPHLDWSRAPTAYQGGLGNQESQQCPQPGCSGFLIGTTGHGGGMPDGMPQSAGVFNSETGQTVYPAPHCTKCGYIAKAGSNYTPGGGYGAVSGVRPSGPPRLAPGAGSSEQVAHQHGLPNLFA